MLVLTDASPCVLECIQQHCIHKGHASLLLPLNLHIIQVHKYWHGKMQRCFVLTALPVLGDNRAASFLHHSSEPDIWCRRLQDAKYKRYLNKQGRISFFGCPEAAPILCPPQDHAHVHPCMPHMEHWGQDALKFSAFVALPQIWACQ